MQHLTSKYHTPHIPHLLTLIIVSCPPSLHFSLHAPLLARAPRPSNCLKSYTHHLDAHLPKPQGDYVYEGAVSAYMGVYKHFGILERGRHSTQCTSEQRRPSVAEEHGLEGVSRYARSNLDSKRESRELERCSIKCLR